MRSERGILGAVTALHATVGALIATSVPGPVLAVDDLAYLAMGRTLAGEGAAPLGAQPPYGILYPVLLAPGWLLGLDEGSMLTWARLLNALLGAALVPLLYLLVRRVTAVGFGWALTAALIGASLPALLVTGSIVWTERLLPLLLAVGALVLCRLHERPTQLLGVGAGAVAAALYATHPRTGPTALVLIAAAMWFARRRRVDALIPAGVGLGGIVVAEWARSALADAAFSSTGTYDALDLASRRGVGEVPDMVMRAGGTMAYVVLATAGLAIVGLVVLARDRTVGPWLIAMVAATVVVAGWFLVGVERADAHLHGRYIEVFAPLLAAFGVIGLRGAGTRLLGAAAALTVAAGLLAAWAGPGDNWMRPRTPVMMLGTEAGGAPFGTDLFEPGAATSVALLVGGLFVLLARQARPWLLLAIGLAVMALGTLSARVAVDELYDASATGRVAAALADLEIDEVMIDTVRVPPSVAGAVAWEVGFDNASTEIGPGGTHLLLPDTVEGPPGAEPIAELDGAVLWRLR